MSRTTTLVSAPRNQKGRAGLMASMRLTPALCFVAFAGCTGNMSAPPSSPTTSYVRDIQPLVERSCLGCHTTGGIAPMSFETPELAQAAAPAMWSALEGNRMPPFFAARSCNSYQNDLRLTDEEKVLFHTWVTEGTPRGDDAEARHVPPVMLPTVRHDIAMDIGGDFDVSVMGATDNYRCFVMNPGNASEDLQVTGYDVQPGNLAVVHHLLAYVVPPAQVDELLALDAQTPDQLGYPCQSGGVGIQGAIQNQIAGWVPGQFPSKMPADTALTLARGSRLVVQVHYNLNALNDPSVSHLDHTTLALETAPAGTHTTAKILPMLKPNLDIKSGDATSVQTLEVNVPNPFKNATIYRAMGHAHQLASRVKMEIVHSDGSTACVLDNPEWDFNWQRDYTLEQPITVKPGDKLRITCTYDNSAGNQAYENGVQRAPRDVHWGESSYDEMCMTYLTFTQPTP